MAGGALDGGDVTRRELEGECAIVRRTPARVFPLRLAGGGTGLRAVIGAHEAPRSIER